MIRQPIITVMGHVDHGKTTLLDSIRGTTVADREAGAITQHIGATEVPLNVIEKISGELIRKFGFKLSIPGLLFIDTPGHEAFTNLRKRGGSIADLAVLVIDITQGPQPQTIEALEILRSYKTPFLIAANKIDKLFEWNSIEGSFSKNLENQSPKGLKVLDEKVYETVGWLYEKGFQCERFDRCSDFTKQIPIIPLSAKTKEGLPELLMLLSGLSQKFLEKNLEIHESEAGKGTILEVKEERGLGTTIDVILYEGHLSLGDEIVLGGKNGIIKAKIRALLEPKPLSEMRESGEKFASVKIVYAATGVKIAAPGLDDALSGSPVLAAAGKNEEQIIKDELGSIQFDTELVGPILKTDTLGALEALIKLLELNNLKPKKADVGSVNRKDIMEAISVKELDAYKGVVFAFNVKIDDIAQAEAIKRDIKIFNGNIIYRLIEDYQQWLFAEREKQKNAVLEKIALPAKFVFLPGFIFRNSKPAVIGIKVLEGTLRPGIRVINRNGIIGTVDAIQSKGESVKEAKKGDEVAVSISGFTVGRDLNEKDELYSLIPSKDFEEIQKVLNAFSDGEKELLNEIKQMQKL